MKNLFSQQKIYDLIKLIDSSKKIAIVTHVNPDGDAIGSTVAWNLFLKELSADSTIIVPNPFPDFLKWISGSEEIQVYSQDRNKAEKLLRECDLLFCLDFNRLSRLEGGLGDFIESLDIKTVLIDHHLGPKEDDFEMVFSVVPISSTCEIVYHIIHQITGKECDSLPVAEALYTGIMTDTGTFTHSTTAELLRTVAELMECGIDREKIHSNVNNNFSEHRMRLMGYCLYEKMTVIPEYKTAYFTLTQKELEKFNFESGDTEGFVNIPLSIKDVVLSVFFVESKHGFIKISLRSEGEFSVDEMARKHFNGGGHKNASGGKSFVSLEETVEYFKSILPEFKEKLVSRHT